MTSSLRQRGSVIMIPSAPRLSRSLEPIRLAGTDLLPGITLSPTSAFHLDLFSSKPPAFVPPSTRHPFSTISRGHVDCHQSSGSEASSPRIPQTRQAAPPQSSDMSRTTSSASDKSSRSRSTGPTKRFAFASAAEASPDIVQPRQRTTSNGSIGHGLSVNGRPLTRDAGQAIKEDKEEDESDVDEFAPRKSKVAHKESLAELVRRLRLAGAAILPYVGLLNRLLSSPYS